MLICFNCLEEEFWCVLQACNVLTDWFAQKNVDNTAIFVTIFITGMKQVRSINYEFVPLQSESAFYKRAKLTGAQCLCSE